MTFHSANTSDSALLDTKSKSEHPLIAPKHAFKNSCTSLPQPFKKTEHLTTGWQMRKPLKKKKNSTGKQQNSNIYHQNTGQLNTANMLT